MEGRKEQVTVREVGSVNKVEQTARYTYVEQTGDIKERQMIGRETRDSRVEKERWRIEKHRKNREKQEVSVNKVGTKQEGIY